MREKVAIIGSGNWGSAIARVVGQTVDLRGFESRVSMWVHDEQVNGRSLCAIINEQHENVKYLPGFKLPENIVACSELADAVADATMLVFVLPHQYLRGVCSKMAKMIRKDAKACSLIKGLDFEDGSMKTVSQVINAMLGIDVCVLSGANIAAEIAAEQFCESTLGYRNESNAKLFCRLFDTKYFRISMVEDVIGCELCGALKNVVGLAAGLADGLKCGANTKAAVIRMGLSEMKRFISIFWTVKERTFWESCGVGDVIATCYGGRNRRVAEAFVGSGKTFDELECEMLGGQKLQGTLTAKEVWAMIEKRGLEREFPLFGSVYGVVFQGMHPSVIFGGNATQSNVISKL